MPGTLAAILQLTDPTRCSAHHLPVPINHSPGTTAAAEATSTRATEDWDRAHLGFTLILTNRKTTTAEKVLTVCIMLVVCFHLMRHGKQTLGSRFGGRVD